MAIVVYRIVRTKNGPAMIYAIDHVRGIVDVVFCNKGEKGTLNINEIIPTCLIFKKSKW